MSKRLTIEEFIKTLKSGGSSSGGGNLVLRVTSTEQYTEHQTELHQTFIRSTLNHTWQEVYDAVAAGAVVILVDVDESETETLNLHCLIAYAVDLAAGSGEENPFTVTITTDNASDVRLTADSKDSYLTMVSQV